MKRIIAVIAIAGSTVLAEAESVYRTYLSAAQATEMKGGIVVDEHFLVLNFKKPEITEPGRPLLEARNNIPMWDNFIVGLEPKNKVPIDPDEEQWARYELDAPVSPGKMVVLLYLWNFRRAEKSTSKLTVEVDGKSVSYDFPFMEGPYKGHGYKWIPFEFNIDKPVKEFSVRLAPPPVAPFIIKHMFVSNQAGDIGEFAKARGYGAYPLVVDDPFAVKAEQSGAVEEKDAPRNLLKGSDFETGMGFGWRSRTYNYLYNERTCGSAAGYQSARCLAPEGAMGIYTNMTLMSDPFRVGESGKYVLSFYARTVNTNDARMRSAVKTDPKFTIKGADREHTFTDSLTAEWRRYSHPMSLGRGHAAVELALPYGGQVDRVQLEKDELRPYAQALDIELGALFKDRFTHAFRSDEKIPVKLLVSARDKNLKQAEFKAEIVDFHNHIVWSRDFKVKLKNGVGEVDVDLQNGRPGIYRLQLSRKDAMEHMAEIVFTNHLPEEDYQDGLPSSIGFYAALGHSSLETLKQSGMNHAITFSCFPQTGHWNVVGKGPTASDVVFFDDYVNLCRLYGIELTVNIDYRRAAMKWLKTRKGSKIMPADMNDWRVFLETIMGHYGDRVNAWLILDDLSHYFSPADYKEFVEIAVDVHKRVVPDSKLIVWIYNSASCYFNMEISDKEKEEYGDYFSKVTDVLFMADAGWCGKFAGKKEVRRYFFGGAADDMYAMFFTNHGEIGGPPNSIRRVKSTTHVVKRAIKEFADYQIDRLQYYDARTPPSQMSIYHFDGTLTPAGHAFSVLNHFMKGKRFFKKHELPGLDVNEFRDPDGRSFVTLWSRSGDPIDLFLPVKPDDLELCDVVGTPVVVEEVDGGSKIPVSADVLYLKTLTGEFDELLADSKLNNIAPFSVFLEPGKDDRHLNLTVGLRNRTDNPQELVMHFSPTGIDWNTGRGDFHDDLLAVMKNFDKTLKPGETEMLRFPVRYLPGQEYVLRGLNLSMKWMGEKSDSSREMKASYASRIPDKAKPDAVVKPLLEKNRFNRIMNIDLSIRYPGGKNKADVRCFPRWDSKNLYFTTRILAEGYVLGNPRNFLKLFIDPDPVANWNRAEDKKEYVKVKADLNTGKVVLDGKSGVKPVRSEMKKTAEELVIEWAVPWNELGVEPPAKGKLVVLGMNFSYLTASAAEEFFYPWMDWSDRTSDIPDSIGYLVVGQ